MLCDECKKNPATVHITRIVNNQKVERHLCSVCAEKYGGMHFPFEPTFSINSLLSGLLNQGVDYGPGAESQSHKERCENCGCSFEDFKQTGRLGCSECYRVFAPNIEPILRRIHGSSNHSGKVPLRYEGQIHASRKIDTLRAKLAKLIEKEEFEEAAAVRDEIKELEKEDLDRNQKGGDADAVE